MQTKKEARGGTRKGAGAKPKYGEPTKQIVFRCPESKVVKMKTLIRSKLSNWEEITTNNQNNVCPKCGSVDVIWTCYCNECNECM